LDKYGILKATIDVYIGGGLGADALQCVQGCKAVGCAAGEIVFH